MNNQGKGFNRPEDFDIKYRFFSVEEGGKTKQPVLQGYRCDWSYEGDNLGQRGMYMIWPLFEDRQGQIIPIGTPVLSQGIARMYILDDKLKNELHRHRIKIGIKGYMMEAQHKVAEAEVIRIVGM